MRWTGFEPASLSTPELESGPLTTRAPTLNIIYILYFLFNFFYIKKYYNIL